MTTQAVRVALWVPTVDPASPGDAIMVQSLPVGGPQEPIPTQFQDATGGTGQTSFASPAEIATGTVVLKAVDPAGLRGELVRVFGGVSADYTNAAVKLDSGTF